MPHLLVVRVIAFHANGHEDVRTALGPQHCRWCRSGKWGGILCEHNLNVAVKIDIPIQLQLFSFPIYSLWIRHGYSDRVYLIKEQRRCLIDKNFSIYRVRFFVFKLIELNEIDSILN